MFCNNKSGQVEYHEYCWEQTDKIGVIHSKEIVNMSNTGNIQLASELSVAVQTIKTAGYTLAMGYANGNLIYVNTSREKKDGENDEKIGESQCL